jgi:hypothetical protein
MYQHLYKIYNLYKKGVEPEDIAVIANCDIKEVNGTIELCKQAENAEVIELTDKYF